MARCREHHISICRISRGAAIAALITSVFVLTVLASQPAPAQTFSVIHNFTGGGDGDYPEVGLTMDKAGNLYGTTEAGAGTVFKLAHKSSGWVLTTLFTFDYTNGNEPFATPIIGPDGTLYGTTGFGGSGSGDGVVYDVRPSPTRPATVLAPWMERVLYGFPGGMDGDVPHGGLVLDRAGNLYGTTENGGLSNCTGGCGVVYELTPSNGGWTEKILYSFTGIPDGYLPLSGVIFDESGNLYGTTFSGGLSDNGTVYELTPSASGWTETVLYAFQGGSDGQDPWSGLIRDRSGNLYGTTRDGGSGQGGTVFMLSPANGGWTLTTLYSFAGSYGGGPQGSMIMDAAGNFYGTTAGGGSSGYGTVFKLVHNPDGTWTHTSLHDFTGGRDGGFVYGGVIMDAAGNLYGTAAEGGYDGNCGFAGCGVVFEITP